MLLVSFNPSLLPIPPNSPSYCFEFLFGQRHHALDETSGAVLQSYVANTGR